VTLDIAQGRLASAEQHMNAYVAKGGNNITVLVVFTAQQHGLREAQGRLGEIVPIWQGALQRWPGLPIFPSALCLSLTRAGRAAEAAAELERVVADMSSIPRDFLWKPVCALLSDACADIGHRGAAATLYDALIPYARDGVAVAQSYAMGSVAYYLGRLATVLERWNEAQQHFEAALLDNGRTGFTTWVASTQLSYAQMLHRRGNPDDTERARTLLTNAVATATECGMLRVQTEGERLLAETARTAQPVQPVME